MSPSIAELLGEVPPRPTGPAELSHNDRRCDVCGTIYRARRPVRASGKGFCSRQCYRDSVNPEQRRAAEAQEHARQSRGIEANIARILELEGIA